MRIVALLLVAVALVLPGCFTYAGGIAPSNKPLSENYSVMEKVSGTSWGVNLFGILTVKMADTSKALAEAESSIPSDGLIRVTVNNTGYYFLILNLQRIEVQGVAVQTRR